MTPTVINLNEKFGKFHSQWDPKIVGELNGQHVKLVKIKGEFLWHQHEEEDELFLVLRGSFEMQYRNGAAKISEGEFVIVPRGVEHRPVAEEEAHILLFEPTSARNTGNAGGERTVENPERI
jgi:mannose-6-phosphate isomerase-like protein (cupin superfamily)